MSKCQRKTAALLVVVILLSCCFDTITHASLQSAASAPANSEDANGDADVSGIDSDTIPGSDSDTKPGSVNTLGSNVLTDAMKSTLVEAAAAVAAGQPGASSSTASTTSASTSSTSSAGSMLNQDDLDADLYDQHEETQYEHTNQSHNGHWGTPPTHTIEHHHHNHSNHHPHTQTQTHTHKPPDAFKLAARIKHKTTKSKSYYHLSTTQDPLPSIPFLECNSIGTTTPPIPANNVSFRSFPKSAHPSSFSYTRGFIVPLTKIEIEVHDAKDKRRIFEAGDIIWVDGEYRMCSADEHDLSALIINVPKSKDPMSADFNLFKMRNYKKQVNMMNCNEGGVWDEDDDNYLSSVVKSLQDVKGSVGLMRMALGMAGVGLSSLMTYFWIKVAPLQLAVGIGGVCMVGGGTLATILGGEMVCDQLQEYLVKVREDGDNTSEDEDDLNLREDK